MHLSFQYKLEPNEAQKELLARTAGCARFVWNKGVALNKELKTKNEPVKNYVNMAKELTAWRHELDWLAETSSCVQQQALRTLEKSRLEALDPKLKRGEPRFKSKWRAKDGFLVPNRLYKY